MFDWNGTLSRTLEPEGALIPTYHWVECCSKIADFYCFVLKLSEILLSFDCRRLFQQFMTLHLPLPSYLPTYLPTKLKLPIPNCRRIEIFEQILLQL